MDEKPKSNRGGARPGAGRPPVKRNVFSGADTAYLSELARQHTQTAIDVLVAIAKGGESESSRVVAANALLDRGYGKPAQALFHSGDGTAMIPPVITFVLDKDDEDEGSGGSNANPAK